MLVFVLTLSSAERAEKLSLPSNAIRYTLDDRLDDSPLIVVLVPNTVSE